MSNSANAVSYEQRKAQTAFEEANKHGAAGAFAAAHESIDRALKFFPKNPQYLFTKAMVFEAEKRYAEAEPLWRRVSELLPDQAASWFYLGRVCNNLGKRDEAIQYYRSALRIAPTSLEALVNLANEIMHHKHEHDLEKLERGILEAIDLLTIAVKHHPGSIEALSGLGLALQRLGRVKEAVPYFERAHHIAPNNADVLVNLGFALSQLARFEEADVVFKKGIALGDWYSEFMYAQFLLLRGDIVRGTKAFEARFNDAEVPPRTFPYPQWRGEELSGKTLYIWAEQGIGDEIMHASLLPDVISRAGKVHLEADPRLVPVYRRAFPNVQVINRRMKETEPAIPIIPADYHVPVGSMMAYAKARMDYPVHQGYLKPDAAKIAYYAERYKAHKDKLKIGISWQSRKTETSRMRTIGLKEWLPIFHVPNASFFNLQYGDFQHELDMLEKESGVKVITDPDVDPLTDMENMLGLMANLDLVISCANSTVHIAGSIGTPCWVLTPRIPSWRWLLDRDDSMWYPHVRLFRQSELWRWDDVIGRIQSEMRTLSK